MKDNMKNYRIVIISRPLSKSMEEDGICLKSVTKIPRKKEDTIYDTVTKFKEILSRYPESISLKRLRCDQKTSLEKIINLHDADGIRDLNQVRKMSHKIAAGYHIFSKDNIPNIKIVTSAKREKILFDGHHSTLAYMLNDHQYLGEIPYLEVLNREKKPITDPEIHAFFGKHSETIKDKNWRNFVINWQREESHQLERREQKNMGELLEELKKERYLNI